jgi:sugar lactone lactonase YvrE
MKISSVLGVMLGLFVGSVGFAAEPAPTEGPGVQAARDAREPAVLAACKNLAPQRAPGRPVKPEPIPATYHVKAIPGVIAEGKRWKVIWRTKGNNADGIIATPDGGILIAQNNNSDVVKLTADGHASVVYQDTNTGGALGMNKQGQLFIMERGLNASLWEHKVIANRYPNGDSLDCDRGGFSDLSPAASGFIYFAEAGASEGLLWVSPDGVVTQYPHPLRTDGIILSPDEKTLYVTNNGTLVALDVQPDGSLANQRDLATLEGGGGDGSAVDSEGRIYVSGYQLGMIPANIHLTTVVFSGPDKKTLFVVGEIRGVTKPGAAPNITTAEVLTIPMIAHGPLDRAK